MNATDPPPSDGALGSSGGETGPERLNKQTWATLITFAAFVVLTSSCMIGLFIR